MQSEGQIMQGDCPIPWLASKAPLSPVPRVGEGDREREGEWGEGGLWVGPYRVSLMTATPPARCCTCCSTSLRLHVITETSCSPTHMYADVP